MAAPSDNEMFTAMLLALQGVTVLETPRVSRETMIKVLQDHTTMLKTTRTELSMMSNLVKSLAAEAGDNRRVLQNIQDDAKKTRLDIEALYRLTNDFRIEMDEIGQKIAELYVVKKVVGEHGEQINDLVDKLDSHKNDMSEYINKTGHTIQALDHKCVETQFQLKELREYVDRFGDNLILQSNQIIVESSAGFSTRPLSLLEVLKQTNLSTHEIETTMHDQGKQIADNTATIATKADDTIIFNVDTLETKVKAIESHLKREEEQGVSAIRKSCEQLTEAVDSIQFQLADKVGQDAVDNIVHTKYEDIVQYLKDALSSSAEDENNFKQRAEDLNVLVAKLSSSKADRAEVSAMQEVLVRSEAMLTKLGGNGKDGRNQSYSRKEIEALLELKMDRSEFEQNVHAIVKGSKKKKLSGLGGPPATVLDESILPSAAGMNGIGMGGGGGVGGNSMNNGREAAMWKGLADVMKDESEAAMMRAAAFTRTNSVTGSASSDFSSYIKSKKALSTNKSAVSMSFPNSNNPGMFRTATEGNRAGGENTNHPNGNNNNGSTSPYGYPAGHGQIGGPGYSIASATSLGGGSLNTMSPELYQQFYPHVPPNDFDASQLQLLPGQNAQQLQQHLQYQHYQQQQQQLQQQQMGLGGGGGGGDGGPDMSFLGSQNAGSGFNMRGHNHQVTLTQKGQSLQPLVDSNVEDVEGNGVMVKGIDGHYYYAENEPLAKKYTGNIASNVKNLNTN